MDWEQLIAWVGLPALATPNMESVIAAVVIIAGASAIGWFTGYRAGEPLTERIHKMSGVGAADNVKLVGALIRYSVVALLLLVVGNSVSLGALARMLLAVALGVSVGLLAWQVGKACKLATVVAAVLAIAALVATTAGALGGMAPLISGLDSVGFSVVGRRFSLLAVINALVIVAVIYVVARAAIHVVSYLIGRSSALDVSQRALVQKLAGIGVVVAAVLLGVDLLGIDLTALTVFSGAAGLAVGFGLQKTFGNFIAGVILLMDRSVKPGDVIVVGDTFGEISRIGVRAVSVVTRDGKEHLIPNEQLMTEAVENWSYSSRNVRVHIPVGVAYSSDLALAQRLMVEAAMSSKRVLSDPKPSVWLVAFGDSSVDHEILAWIADPEQGVGNLRSEVLNRLWALFAENGIEIPFPQRDIHVRTMPAPAAAISGPE